MQIKMRHFVQQNCGVCHLAALLTVESDEFWEGVSPVQFGELPALQDAVTVVGYPIGGDTISVTSGVVSRIEILSYVHGSTELLGLQVWTFSPPSKIVFMAIPPSNVYVS